MDEEKKCKDCKEPMGQRGDNHDYCSRCLAIWHSENGITDEIPCGDFDEPPRHED